VGLLGFVSLEGHRWAGDENGCHFVEESGTFALLIVFFRVICCLGFCRRLVVILGGRKLHDYFFGSYENVMILSSFCVNSGDFWFFCWFLHWSLEGLKEFEFWFFWVVFWGWWGVEGMWFELSK
jgi:hypothetical protein